MEIKKIIADKRPMYCCECPLNVSAIKTLKKDACGRQITILNDGGCCVGSKVPDERCLIESEGLEASSRDEAISVARTLVENGTTVLQTDNAVDEGGLIYQGVTFVKQNVDIMSKQEIKLLRQIAEQLLVYCNNYDERD